MRISKEKLDALKRRGRNAGKKVGMSLRDGAMAGGVGAVAFFVHQQVAGRVQALGSRPWATPVLLGVAGHAIKRRSPTAGIALQGAAGYALGMALAAAHSKKHAEAAGLEYETGALVQPRDVGALVGGDVAAYLPAETGAVQYVPDYGAAVSIGT